MKILSIFSKKATIFKVEKTITKCYSIKMWRNVKQDMLKWGNFVLFFKSLPFFFKDKQINFGNFIKILRLIYFQPFSDKLKLNSFQLIIS